MLKLIKNSKFKYLRDILYTFFLLLFIFVIFETETNYEKIKSNISSINVKVFEKPKPENITLDLLFTGDVFLDRGIDKLSQKSKLKYAYPFQGLDTLGREKYDAWIGNLECPVTDKQSTVYEKENYLKFSCKKEYLPELKKYFDIVSLANNHTDNMDHRNGLEETRKHLDDIGIKYFGDYDNSQTDNLCEIIKVKNIPILFCGYHGVYKLPTNEQLKTISEYSKYFITFVMPHQGIEYSFKSNSYQKKIYRSMIDDGADAVIGSHPHVIEETEIYKGKRIFYSLGNFIFDQTWIKTREHLTVKTEIKLNNYNHNYEKLDCEKLPNIDCLAQAKKLGVIKPNFEIIYTPIFTNSGTDFITRKTEISKTDYLARLKQINFTDK